MKIRISLNKYLQFRRPNIYVISREKLFLLVYSAGLFLAFLTSMNPWPLWNISRYYMVITAVLIGTAIILSNGKWKKLINKDNHKIPALIILFLYIYQTLIAEGNVSMYIAGLFNSAIIYSFLNLDYTLIKKIVLAFSKILAGFLSISLALFFLYLLGFPIPGGSNLVSPDDFYSFSNYYFFLIDDRQLLVLFPRFQSIFIEPSQLGVVCVLLLQVDRGNWKKWHNIVLLISTLMSFSLGAYVYLFAVIFLNLWTERKKIIKKVLIVSTLLASVFVASFFYNGGDNLLQNLIVARLEVKDGKLAGNNRTTEDFDKEYSSFLQSDRVLFGKKLENSEFGNSGYKVYIYQYGIVGTSMLLMFFLTAYYPGKDTRSKVSAFIITFLIFLVDGFVLWYCRLIPLFCTATTETEKKRLEDTVE